MGWPSIIRGQSPRGLHVKRAPKSSLYDDIYHFEPETTEDCVQSRCKRRTRHHGSTSSTQTKSKLLEDARDRKTVETRRAEDNNADLYDSEKLKEYAVGI
ncbi:hypothetical protein ScPMuIL_016352 [Solemya velum]